MIQTLALLNAAYRELNARKLFWVTMVLSLLIVGVFAILGINERGITILWWEFESEFFNTFFFPREVFYKVLFANFGVNWWLAWLATMLALVSTASIVPDMISDGAIDNLLSKPIGRSRLFLTRYCTGLLFVTVQVSVFSIASFLLKSSNELGNDDAHSNGGGTPAYALIIDNDPRDDDDDGLLRGDPFAFAGFPDWGEAYFARRRPPCPAPGGSTAANGSPPERHAAAQTHTP